MTTGRCFRPPYDETSSRFKWYDWRPFSGWDNYGWHNAAVKTAYSFECVRDSGEILVKSATPKKGRLVDSIAFADASVTTEIKKDEKKPRRYLTVTIALRFGYSATLSQNAEVAVKGVGGGDGAKLEAGFKLGWSVSIEGGVTEAAEHAFTFICECCKA